MTREARSQPVKAGCSRPRGAVPCTCTGGRAASRHPVGPRPGLGLPGCEGIGAQGKPGRCSCLMGPRGRADCSLWAPGHLRAEPAGARGRHPAVPAPTEESVMEAGDPLQGGQPHPETSGQRAPTILVTGRSSPSRGTGLPAASHRENGGQGTSHGLREAARVTRSWCTHAHTHVHADIHTLYTHAHPTYTHAHMCPSTHTHRPMCTMLRVHHMLTCALTLPHTCMFPTPSYAHIHSHTLYIHAHTDTHVHTDIHMLMPSHTCTLIHITHAHMCTHPLMHIH